MSDTEVTIAAAYRCRDRSCPVVSRGVGSNCVGSNCVAFSRLVYKNCLLCSTAVTCGPGSNVHVMNTVYISVPGHPLWARDVAHSLTETEPSEETEVVILYVFEGDDLASTRANLNVPESNLQYSLDDLATRKSGVKAIESVLEGTPMEPRVRGIEAGDKPGKEIASLAAKDGAKRIYLFSRQRSPAGKAVFGSRPQEVLSHAKCPVVVVPFNGR